MKTRLLPVLAGAALAASPLSATEYLFSNFDVTLADHRGQPWSVSLDVALGRFAAGFNPTLANLGDWSAHWIGATDGYYDPAGPEWGGALVLADNTTFAVGDALFLWVMADGVLGREVALFTDPLWVVDVNDPLDLNPRFLDFSADTVARIGSLDYANGLATTAVPEPSTYGLLAALGLAALVGGRRWLRPRP